ncbi:hypothetical protein Y032_0273g1001 [Ancylostoma ceylanicum]|uniref:Uncharacterized protein n=2 Tax=Ancylostoma ceylanicum TaxID=53326 RepID=A0A016S8Q5_9BILA|nr:hypothetical protein Y032_0273g1001 [Ancylostoma ceylanicum]
MWLLIALASVAQTVLCEDITQDQNKTCTRSAISVKAYGKAAKIPFPSGEQPKDKNKTDPSHENTSNFTLRLETMTVREGNGDPVIVQRLTGLDNDGAVRSMAEFSILDKGKGKHTILLPGRFDDFVKRCTVVRMHKMSGAYMKHISLLLLPCLLILTDARRRVIVKESKEECKWDNFYSAKKIDASSHLVNLIEETLQVKLKDDDQITKIELFHTNPDWMYAIIDVRELSELLSVRSV